MNSRYTKRSEIGIEQKVFHDIMIISVLLFIFCYF